jgi:hypothetical protein
MAVVCQDYLNIVYRLSRDFSWQWVPVVDLENEFDGETTDFWPVYADVGSLFGVPLRGMKSPGNNPIPNLKEMDMSPLTLDRQIRPWLIRRLDASLDKGLMEKETCKELVKLYSDSLEKHKHLRSVQIAEMIRIPKVRDSLVTAADRCGLSIVADKLTGSKRKKKKKNLENDKNKRNNIVNSAQKLQRESSGDVEIYVRDEDDVEGLGKVPEKVPGFFDGLKELGARNSVGVVVEDNGKKEKIKKKVEPLAMVRNGKKGKMRGVSGNFKPLFE